MAKRLCLALLAIAAAPAPASGTATLAAGPNGSEALLYQPLQQPSRPLFAASRPPTGSFGPLKAIGQPRGVFDTRLAVDDAGGAIAAWIARDPQGFVPDRGFASVGFGAPTQIFFEPPNRPIALGANGAGDAIVGWSSTVSHYVFRPAGGAFGEASEMPVSGFFRGLSVDPDGTAHAFSELQLGDGSSEIYEAVRPPRGEFGAATAVAHLAQSNGVSFAAARNGRVLFVWNEGRAIRGMDRAPGGSFSPRFALPGNGSVLGLAVAPSGAAVVAIRRSLGSNVVAARTPAGPFVASLRLTGLDPRVAIDDAGDAAAVWTARDRAVRAIYRMATKRAFGRRISLAAARRFAPGFEAPTVAIANSGRATAAWEQSDSARITVLARDFRDSRGGHREVVGSFPSFVREGPASACRPDGARIVRVSRRSTVFFSGTEYYGCLLARGLALNLTGFGESVQRPSTISLAGPLVAFATQTQIKVLDLRDRETGVNGTADLGRHAFVAAIRLRATGSVGWIACPSRCTGNVKKLVFGWSRGIFAPRLLDSGRAISPGSLRLRGSRLTWRHGGTLRRARLR